MSAPSGALHAGPGGDVVMLPEIGKEDSRKSLRGDDAGVPPARPVEDVGPITPYLDVLTISSAQMPVAIEGGKNQESHTRLLVEPVTVPNLEHTGVAPNFVAKEAPLFYPNGLRNCNLRETIRVSLRTADPESGEPAGIRSPSRSPTRARVSAGAGAGSDVVGAGGGASGGAAAGGRSVSRGKRKPHGRSGVRVRPDAKAGPPRATGRPRQSTMELAKHTQPRRRDTGARRPSAASAHTAGSRASVTSDRAALKKRPVDRSTMDLLKEMNAQNERMARTLERC